MYGQRQTVTAADAPAAIGPYSHAVRAAGELLFCSGQIPLDPATGELVGESAGEQARRCLDNLRAVCVAAGTTLERAVRLTIYMTDLERFGEVNKVCAEFFPDDPPARATVGVAALPRGAQVEIDAVVALSEDGAAAPPPAGTWPPTGAPVPPAPSPAARPGQVYHLELRHFPRNLCRFNLSAEELHATVLGPWAADRPFELGELKWDPRQARLTVLEGPRLAPGDLTMGRGWGVAKRRSREVTERVLAAAVQTPSRGPGG
ncbi:MAG TPA: Rid family detoxifying hydrolase [Solirubrobacteraceae bacterium]|jgi:2-iminobutanoate/2-iminopropanoate deaminase|nr:Rid family detoxifying hydrolase [Solirubrobacteraceae bacterium]